MTSDHHFTDMAGIDAELERLLSGGSPSAEAPAWFGDVAVLVRTARAPARPDELAGEADIVARMVEVRLAVLAEATTGTTVAGQDDSDEADAPPVPAPRVNGHVNGRVNGHVNGVNATAAEDDETGSETDGSETDGSGTGSREPGGPTAREPLEERLRERMSQSDLDEYRAKHGGERYYVAKHAAPAVEEPPHAVARTVGRVIAMKAVAITTAAVIGVAAAAAATTGIVANVVVPAFNDHFQHPVPTSESPDGQKDDDGETGSGRGSRRPSVSIVTCPTVLAPCVPPPLNSVVTDPVTGATLVAPATTAPDSTSTSVPADTTTSTTSSTTSTTEPGTSTTLTPTTVSGDPQSLSP
jgi:hypothetical protein